MPDPDPACLHCHIHEAIELYFDEHGERHGDDIVFDSGTILDAMGRIIAEMLIVEPDAKVRGEICVLFVAKILREVKEARAAGHTGGPVLRPS
jgi:hypothetical protein